MPWTSSFMNNHAAVCSVTNACSSLLQIPMQGLEFGVQGSSATSCFGPCPYSPRFMVQGSFRLPDSILGEPGSRNHSRVDREEKATKVDHRKGGKVLPCPCSSTEHNWQILEAWSKSHATCHAQQFSEGLSNPYLGRSCYSRVPP